MATAVAHPNIALVKYWGKRDLTLNLPSTGSISMTLDRFFTRTKVVFGVDRDVAILNGRTCTEQELKRITDHLDVILPSRTPAQIITDNNFPTAAGLASSSSAFAALTMAAVAEARQSFSPEALSVLARVGSGSACRSIWGGFVEWQRGKQADGSDSHGTPLAPQDHWDLRMCVCMVDRGPKKMGSRPAMLHTMQTSPMYEAWVKSYGRDVKQARQAILDHDLPSLGDAMERSTWKMHSTTLTATPPVRYIRSTSLRLIEAVEQAREEGLPCWWTMDAGPNVKVLTDADHADEVVAVLSPHVEQVECVGVGGPAHLE